MTFVAKTSLKMDCLLENLQEVLASTQNTFESKRNGKPHIIVLGIMAR